MTGVLAQTPQKDSLQKYSGDPLQGLSGKKKMLLAVAILTGTLTGATAGILLLSLSAPSILNQNVLTANTNATPSPVKISPDESPTWTTYTASTAANPFRIHYPRSQNLRVDESGGIILTEKSVSQSITSENTDLIRIDPQTHETLFTYLLQAEKQEEVVHPESEEILVKVSNRLVDGRDAVEYVIEPTEHQSIKRYVYGVLVNYANTYYDVSLSKNSSNALIDSIPEFEKIVNSIEFL